MIYNASINKYASKTYPFWPSYTLEGMVETIQQIVVENNWTLNDTLKIHGRWYYKHGCLYERLPTSNYYEFVVKIN
jgi:hypothetical protein